MTVPIYERPDGGTVVPMPSPYGGALVASRSLPGAWWHVSDDGCPCPATIERCFHVRAVETYVRQTNDAARARDRARLGDRAPNKSMMVD